eukprot:TRINITY_DN69139_c0_g1_i1.p1 TRINITY_DN69139_c0_g1~~TRINITY_DN69139_c0_g1_i1.p1  ORF type:complete len:281 (-),score=83.22 TRINITY_DN69139_c0_g1_i1:240-1082(-)
MSISAFFRQRITSKRSLATGTAALAPPVIDLDGPPEAAPEPEAKRRRPEAPLKNKALEDLRGRFDEKLQSEVVLLTEDEASWVLVVRAWKPVPNAAAFQAEWDKHPATKKTLKIFGKPCEENRFSQMWGGHYKYSGLVSEGHKIEPNTFVGLLVEEANKLWPGFTYNACLQNWYEPEHTIGLHSDDERAMRQGAPIFSLSWGGPRRFVLKGKPFLKEQKIPHVEKHEILMHDGDLVIMGGNCQKTHKHEVPPLRKSDLQRARRINWTIRSLMPQTMQGGA